MIRAALLAALILAPAAPAAVDLELSDATLGEAALALAARGVPAVCVVDDGRRATVRFSALAPEAAARFVAHAFEVPLRAAGDRFALGGDATGSVLLAVEAPGTLAVELAVAGRTVEIALPGGGAVRIAPLLFGGAK